MELDSVLQRTTSDPNSRVGARTRKYCVRTGNCAPNVPGQGPATGFQAICHSSSGSRTYDRTTGASEKTHHQKSGFPATLLGFFNTTVFDSANRAIARIDALGFRTTTNFD